MNESGVLAPFFFWGGWSGALHGRCLPCPDMRTKKVACFFKKNFVRTGILRNFAPQIPGGGGSQDAIVAVVCC